MVMLKILFERNCLVKKKYAGVDQELKNALIKDLLFKADFTGFWRNIIFPRVQYLEQVLSNHSSSPLRNLEGT